MNVLVTYLSSSGNTKKLAGAIFDGVHGDKELKPMSEVDDASAYDVIFIGFPIIAQGAPRKVKRFLSTKAQGKKVAIFVTHGMPSDMDMLKPMLNNCWSAANSSEILGTMECQGRLVGWMASLFKLYPNAEVRRWVRAGGESIGIGHPSEEDLMRARAFANNLTKERNRTITA